MPAFTDEDLQVYYQIARQTSVILQNISLLNETPPPAGGEPAGDFSRQLRGLDSERIVRACSKAQACLVRHMQVWYWSGMNTPEFDSSRFRLCGQ